MKHTTISDAPEPTIADLKQIRENAERLLELELLIEDLKRSLSQLSKEHFTLSRETLPDMMTGAGVTSIGIHNVIVAIEPLVLSSLPKEDPVKRRAAIDWVTDHGYGGIVKRTLDVDMPDAEVELRIVDAIEKLAKRLKIELNPHVEATIHHATYSKLGRDLVKEGVAFPPDILNIFVGRIATVAKEEKK